MSAHWSTSYVGTPYLEFGRTLAGCDCWGLACVVYAAELGITLPSYDGLYASTEEHAEIAALLADGKSSWSLTSQPRSFDLVGFRRGKWETHVGIIVAPGLMLHVAADDQAKIESYTAGRWGNRSTGIYRHFEMASRGAR